MIINLPTSSEYLAVVVPATDMPDMFLVGRYEGEDAADIFYTILSHTGFEGWENAVFYFMKHMTVNERKDYIESHIAYMTDFMKTDGMLLYRLDNEESGYIYLVRLDQVLSYLCQRHIFNIPDYRKIA